MKKASVDHLPVARAKDRSEQPAFRKNLQVCLPLDPNAVRKVVPMGVSTTNPNKKEVHS